MNYRHIYHAGNFADIVKHIILITILDQLKKKDKSFAILDAFAGSGLYDITSDLANKTAESEHGIKKLLSSTKDICTIAAVQMFLDIVNLSENQYYPGSPFIIKQLLRDNRPLQKRGFREEFEGETERRTAAHLNVREDSSLGATHKLPLEVEFPKRNDRLIACELHSSDYLTLKSLFVHDKQVSVYNIDAYQAIKAFLPFPEKRGLIFLDPPFEVKNEFIKLLTALKTIQSRALNICTLIWYPVKDNNIIKDFYHNCRAMGFKEIIIVEYELLGASKNMLKCGLLIINPPDIKKL